MVMHTYLDVRHTVLYTPIDDCLEKEQLITVSLMKDYRQSAETYYKDLCASVA